MDVHYIYAGAHILYICVYIYKMWVDYVYGVWLVVWKKVSSKVEGCCLQELCISSNSIWK